VPSARVAVVVVGRREGRREDEEEEDAERDTTRRIEGNIFVRCGGLVGLCCYRVAGVNGVVISSRGERVSIFRVAMKNRRALPPLLPSWHAPGPTERRTGRSGCFDCG